MLENEFFEAKSQLWALDSKDEQLSLAKDISSLANAHGGIIVVGLATGKAPTYQRNEVIEIRPLPESLRPNEDRYSNVIEEWVFPPPDLSIRWHPTRNDPSHGLISFYIREQSDADRPFLVAHYLGERGKTIDAVFGLHQRLGATTKTTDVKELHNLLREGRRLDEIHQKLDAIMTKVEEGASPRSTTWKQRLLKMIKPSSD